MRIENDSTSVIRLNFSGEGCDLDRFEFVQLAGAPVLKGDVNLDGAVTFTDIPAFIGVLQTGVFQAEADANCDTFVNFADIPAFIAILQGLIPN